MDRLRVATVWLGGCSGCHMSFLDLDEFLLELAPKIELLYSPFIDVKLYPPDVHLCLVEGALCNQDHLQMLHQVRQRTRLLVAFGDCAVTGNVPAIRNQLGLDNAARVLRRAYLEGPLTNPAVPSAPGILPPLLEQVQPLHQVVHVDSFLPGCPPPAACIKALLRQVLDGAQPKLEGPQLKFG